MRFSFCGRGDFLNKASEILRPAILSQVNLQKIGQKQGNFEPKKALWGGHLSRGFARAERKLGIANVGAET